MVGSHKGTKYKAMWIWADPVFFFEFKTDGVLLLLMKFPLVKPVRRSLAEVETTAWLEPLEG